MKKHLAMWGLGFFWIGVWLLFFVVGWRRLDPDFGWHIKMGQWIVENGGVPKTDPFSYTMANFPFIDHEWLMNVAMWKMYSSIGYGGMAAVFATLVWVTLKVATWGLNRYAAVVPIVLGAPVMANRAGIRPQVLDWLLLTALIRWYMAKDKWRRFRWIYPIMMAIWVNLHGGFALGVVVLGFMVGVRIIESRKIDKWDILVLGGGIFATLVNPYGIRVWYEVIQQMTDKNVRWTIAEWQPFYVNLELGFWLLAGLAGAIFWGQKRKMSWVEMGVGVALFVAALSSLRHMSLFVVYAVTFVAKEITDFWQRVKSREEMAGRAKRFYAMLVMVCVIVAGIETYIGETSLVREREWWYPAKAISYIRNLDTGERILAEYGWGGYLIWKLPGHKTFVDGRMATWKWESNDEKYSDYVFEEYLKVMKGEEVEQVLEKYEVGILLLKKNNEVKNYAREMEIWIAEKWFKMNTEDFGDKLPYKLEELGWVKDYEDEISTIWMHPLSKPVPVDEVKTD